VSEIGGEAVRRGKRSARRGAIETPLGTNWSEMRKKTVFRRLGTSLPLSRKTRDAFEMGGQPKRDREVTVPAKVAGRWGSDSASRAKRIMRKNS